MVDQFAQRFKATQEEELVRYFNALLMEALQVKHIRPVGFFSTHSVCSATRSPLPPILARKKFLSHNNALRPHRDSPRAPFKAKRG